jgi:hypothetical protein
MKSSNAASISLQKSARGYENILPATSKVAELQLKP